MKPISSEARKIRRAALVILALAMVVRVVLIFLAVRSGAVSPSPDRHLYFPEVDYVAKSLLAQHVFGNPYALPTGPTAHLAPVFPWLVSLLYRVFGTGTLGVLSVYLFSAVCASVQYALLVLLAPACGLSPRVGVLAGVAGALVPLHPGVEMMGYDAAFIGVCWVAVLAFTIYSWRRHPSSSLHSALLGFSWGLLMLAAPQMLSVFAGVMILHWWVVPQGTLRLTSIAVVAAALTLFPWMIRNEKALGHLFFIRDNFGLELSVSNHEGAHPLFEQELSVTGSGTFEPRHPSKSVSEAQLVQRMGEVNYNHSRFEEASQWIRTHPRAFLWLTARRIWYFWFTPGLSYKTFFLFPLVAAALVGLVRLFCVSPLAGWLFAVCWVMFPLVYYILLVESRYGYPLYQTSLLLASFAFFDVLKSSKKDLVDFG